MEHKCTFGICHKPAGFSLKGPMGELYWYCLEHVKVAKPIIHRLNHGAECECDDPDAPPQGGNYTQVGSDS